MQKHEKQNFYTAFGDELFGLIKIVLTQKLNGGTSCGKS